MRSAIIIIIIIIIALALLTAWPLQDIANILLQYKGGRGENILRNIVGNKGGLGGRNCTIMCNNTPFFRVENGFFSNTSTHPKLDY